MFTSSSPFSDYVDATFLFVVGLSLLVLLGLLITMAYFVIRYSRKRNPHPSNIEGNIPLEIAWTVIPLALFMVMFYLGWEGYLKVIDIPRDAVTIKVTARMWNWSFEYPNGVTTDSLWVPVGTPVKLTLHSGDVNHSFFIPAFRLKKDVIPNRENTMWFRTSAVASYDVACAEYCGLRHSYMYSKVISLSRVSFDDWYQKTSAQQSKTYLPFVAAQTASE
jgi:cytochrome c oxidase subunit II